MLTFEKGFGDVIDQRVVHKVTSTRTVPAYVANFAVKVWQGDDMVHNGELMNSEVVCPARWSPSSVLA